MIVKRIDWNNKIMSRLTYEKPIIMKTICYILLLLIVYSCNTEVTITPIEVSPSWRGTQGKLVVKKGDLVDTIYDCHFGYTPEYKLLKHLDKEYLFTSCEMKHLMEEIIIKRLVCGH